MSTTFSWRTWLLLGLAWLAGLATTQAQRLAAGLYHTLSIHADGTLWAWGQNGADQLGLGSTITYQATPAQVGTAATWQSVSTSYYHSLAVRQDGTLWAWGNNGYGQLGTGTTPTQSGPQQVGTAATWRSVAAGYLHSVAIRQDGTLWAWGSNFYGELGTSTASSVQTVPTQVGTAANWASVVASNFYTLALKTDGTLWAWGANDSGQLGLGSYGSANNQPMPVQVGTATTWSSLSVGASHVLAVRTNGTLWAWGNNDNGQLGLGTTFLQSAPVQVGTATTWQSVGAGRFHSLALRRDGTLWAWGDNRWSELGTGATGYTQSVPAQVGTATTWQSLTAGQAHSAALRQDGSLWVWGGNFYGQVGAGPGAPQLQPAQIASAPTWRSVATGFDNALGIRTDGSLWAWGQNSNGQLGNGTTLDQEDPVRIGTDTWQSAAINGGTALAVRQDGTLWAWGRSGGGLLGISTPVQVGTSSAWKSVSIGAGHVVALQTDGSLWGWGDNTYGQLGNGTTTNQNGNSPNQITPVRIGTATWQSVSAGVFATLAIRADGTLWAWGSNSNGQLGLGTSGGNQLLPAQVGTAATWTSIAAGVYHALAVRTDGTLWSWGSNFYGELGNGNTNGGSQLTPAQVGTATTWVSVSTRAYASAALRQDGSLWGWGMNDYGGLGLGTTARQPIPVRQGTATWQSASLGTDFGAAIRPDGTLWTWGLNSYGQLGNGLRLSTAPRYVPGGGAVLATAAASPAPLWSLAPNPAHGRTQLMGLPAGPVAGQLFNSRGQLVRTTRAAEVDLAGLPAGLYLLRATAAGTTRTLRLVVE